MPSHHDYDFHRLPERVKRQMARSIADTSFHLREEAQNNSMFYLLRGGGAVAMALLLLLALMGGFGIPGRDLLWDGHGRMVMMAIFIGAGAALGLSAWNRYKLNKLLGFTPGQYLFPFTLIDARKPVLQVADLTKLVRIEMAERRANGSYRHTEVAFIFQDAPARIWKFKSSAAAERFGATLTSLQAQARSAFDRNDVAALLRLDPFFEIRRKNWEPQEADPEPVSPMRKRLAQPVLGGVACALLLAPLLWTGRNIAADMALHTNAQTLKTEAAYQAYLDHGKFYLGEMRGQIPRVAFEETRRKKSVTALRALLKRYPEGGIHADAFAEIHLLYQSAFEKFSAQAATADAALLAAMGQMLEALEKRGDPAVGIRFSRPSTDALAELDARIKSKEASFQGKTIIPAAGHFGAGSAAAREARVVKELQRGFGKIFPNDVLSLKAVKQSDARLPVIVIDYQIEPSGDVYTLDTGDRAFVGLVARFQAGIQVKPQSQPWRFSMEVEPPDHFDVNFKRQPGDDVKGPPDSMVYSVMAERAFDALSAKMRTAFFRPDSEAYGDMTAKAAPGR